MTGDIRLIEAELSFRDDVHVVATLHETPPPGEMLSRLVLESCDIFLAPNEPIYSTRRLNRLANRLLPDLTPDLNTKPDNGSVERDMGDTYWVTKGWYIGVKRYTHEIGTVMIDGFLSRHVGEDQSMHLGNFRAKRVTSVRLYPDDYLAGQAYAGVIEREFIPRAGIREAKKLSRTRKNT